MSLWRRVAAVLLQGFGMSAAVFGLLLLYADRFGGLALSGPVFIASFMALICGPIIALVGRATVGKRVD